MNIQFTKISKGENTQVPPRLHLCKPLYTTPTAALKTFSSDSRQRFSHPVSVVLPGSNQKEVSQPKYHLSLGYPNAPHPANRIYVLLLSFSSYLSIMLIYDSEKSTLSENFLKDQNSGKTKC